MALGFYNSMMLIDVMIKKILLALALISIPVYGATVHGSVYRWNDLENVQALIQVEEEDTLIHQEVVNSSGLYSLDLDQGNYSIYASYGNLTAKQDINLSLNESKQIDLVLTPGTDYVFPDTGELPEYEGVLGPEEDLGNETENKTTTRNGPGDKDRVSDLTIYLAVIALIILLSLTYFLKRRQSNHGKKHIPSDEEEVLTMLREAGGEAYQGDIKEETGYSASKTSELLSNMEEKEKIEREKKGRKKVVKLK